MDKLKQLQSIFLQSLLEPNLDLIHEIDGVKPEKLERLAIYQDGYFYRLYNALVNNFPLLASIMDEDEFSELITAYIHNYPSHCHGLQFFGKQLPAFICQYSLGRKSPYLAEVAELDLALLTASIAVNQQSVKLELLSKLSEDPLGQLKIQLAAHVTALEFNYNIVELWNSSQLNLLEPVKLDFKQRVLFWRKDLINQFRIVDNNLEQQALQFVQAGTNFTSFCEYLSADLNASEGQIGLILQQWVADELLLDDISFIT